MWMYYTISIFQQELSYLKTLYSNYQDFILFDEEFRLILWSEVDLQLAMNEVEYLFNIYLIFIFFIFQTEIFWTTFCSLPQEQQDWEASHKLCQGITHYRKILPLLNKLHNKVRRERKKEQYCTVSPPPLSLGNKEQTLVTDYGCHWS